MAASNRGNMRPQSRSPPFLAIGLFVALCILGFNYWSLSSRNGELANEMAVMESELRLVNAKKVSAEKKSEAILDKMKEVEEYLAQEKAKYSSKEAQCEEFEAKLRNTETDVNTMRSEKEDCLNNVKVCEDNNKSLLDQLDGLKGEIEKLKNTPPEKLECTESTCDQFIVAARERLLQALESSAGFYAIQALHKNNVDIGSYAEKIAQLEAAGGENREAAADRAPAVNQPLVDAANVEAQPVEVKKEETEQVQDVRAAVAPDENVPVETKAADAGLNPDDNQDEKENEDNDQGDNNDDNNDDNLLDKEADQIRPDEGEDKKGDNQVILDDANIEEMRKGMEDDLPQ